MLSESKGGPPAPATAAMMLLLLATLPRLLLVLFSITSCTCSATTEDRLDFEIGLGVRGDSTSLTMSFCCDELRLR